MDGCTESIDSIKLQDSINNVSSVAEQYPLSSQDESFQEATLLLVLLQ